MVDYLKRNKELLDDISSAAHSLNADRICVGKSLKTQFISSGTLDSTTQGLVYTGLKVPLFEDFSKNGIDNFYRALTNIVLINQNHPEIAHQLPLFYGLLVGSHDNPLAVITQDFSNGAQHQVINYQSSSHANIPDGLVDLFDPFGNDMIQLEKALFYVNGERKIGDLDHLFPKENHKLEWDKIRTEVASSNPVAHIKRVPLEELLSDENERYYANLVLEVCHDGPKDHSDVIHADPTYRINYSTQINRILDTLVHNWYLRMWRDNKHLNRTKVFALV